MVRTTVAFNHDHVSDCLNFDVGTEAEVVVGNVGRSSIGTNDLVGISTAIMGVIPSIAKFGIHDIQDAVFVQY